MKYISIFIFLLGLSFSSLAQTDSLSGKITDGQTREGFPGVVIMVKGTNNGTVTDVDGVFTLTNVNPGDTLSINYTGYISKEVVVDNTMKVNVTLSPNAADEVVVIGFETVNKRDVLGPVSSVKATDLKDIPVTDAAQAITGRLAGVQVTTAEGGPGAETKITIRGGGSLTQDNSPIYIVDGVQMDDALQTLNPQDIESIDVLKDASSTAIYGARGANGVVIITTKSGTENKTVITYNGSVGFRQIIKKLDVMDPYNFVVYQYERSRGSADSNNFKETYGSTWDTLANYKNQGEVDWQDEVFGRMAPYINNNLTVSGGTKATKYSMSISSNNEKGIQLNSDFNRQTLNFKFSHDLNQKINVGMNVRYYNQRVLGAGMADPGESTTNRLRHTVTYQPFLSKSAAGDIDFQDEEFNISARLINPVVATEAEYRKRYQDAANLTAFINYKFGGKLKNLSFKSTFGYNKNDRRDEYFWAKTTSTAVKYGRLPVAKIRGINAQIFNNTNVLTFKKNNINEHHDVTALLGQETLINGNRQTITETRYLPEDITPQKALNNMQLGAAPAGAIQPLPFSYQDKSTLISFFGKVNYAFDEKYLASFTLRTDGSSKFASNNRWGLFPAGSVAWRFTDEKFVKLPQFVTEGKVRAGFGIAGNNRIDNYLYTSLFASNNYYGLNGALAPGYTPNALANPNLTWEKTLSRNIGLDLSFLNNRIQVSIDGYYNTIRDLLVDIPIPPQSGYTTQIQNIGETSNRGIELQTTAIVINKKNFQWSTNFNFSHNKNRIEELGSLSEKTISSGWQGSDGADDYIMQVGQPIGQMYGFVTDGFYKVEDFIAPKANSTGTYIYRSDTLANGGIGSNPLGIAPQPGVIKFKDLNGDGRIDLSDRTIIGNSNPKFIGGLNNQFVYKQIDFSIFLNWVVGNDVYNANKIDFTNSAYRYTNLLSDMEGRWRTVNDQGQVVTNPDELTALNADATMWRPMTTYRPYLHSWAVEDGSFLRINNITLGYTFSEKVTKFLKITNLRVYATVNNLYTFTKYSGFDPEVNTRRDTPLTPGVDFAAYPRSRAYIAGVNLTF